MSEGPECELTATESMVHVRLSGGEGDSLSDVCNAAHTEFQWLWNKDDMAFVENYDVVNVDPTSSD